MTDTTPWEDAPLVALDLEGTGGQDHDNEAILEIALVPIIAGQPSVTDSYTTLINPGRPIPRSPWISPGLTDAALAGAPALDQVLPELTARLTGKIIVGHNVGVDARLLRKRCPDLRVEALIDTLRLARRLNDGGGNKLSELLAHHHLTKTVGLLAPDSQPHRALWDTVGAALLLSTLLAALRRDDLTITELRHIAGLPGDGSHNSGGGGKLIINPGQGSLLDL